jgi:Protein of unknown function (DUF3500)
MIHSNCQSRNRFSLFAVTLVALAALSPWLKAATPQSPTAQIVGAANAFLATLNEKQRSAVLYKFDDDRQRARWSDFPTGFVRRGGISLAEMSDAQRTAALALVASALSRTPRPAVAHSESNL